MLRNTIAFALIATAIGLAFTMADASDRFVGKPGPEFEVAEWISDEADTDGKYILLDFWATWCGPCIRAIPHMNELHSEFSDSVAVVGVSRESRRQVEAMTRPVIDYHSAIDPEARMARFFQIRSIPHAVLMDPEGTVVWKGHPARLSKNVLKSFVEKS